MAVIRIVAGVVFALHATTAVAQVHITGLVRDHAERRLADAAVTAESPALGVESRTTATDAEGSYALGDLPPGTYALTFSKPGFSTTTLYGFEIAEDLPLTAHLTLNPGVLHFHFRIDGQGRRVTSQIRDLPAGR
jgi:hypothetical protein